MSGNDRIQSLESVINEGVPAGAAWLDVVHPEWFTRINTETLDLGSACGCVWGQLVGDEDDQDKAGYWTAFRTLALAYGVTSSNYSGGGSHVKTVMWMADHGFTFPQGAAHGAHWDQLNEAWVAEIKKRWEDTAL